MSRFLVLLAIACLAGCASAPPEPEAAPPVPQKESHKASPKSAKKSAEKPTPEEARQEAQADNPCIRPESTGEGASAALDETKRHLRQSVCSAALWIDSQFGERTAHEIDTMRNVSGQAELSAGQSQFYGSNVKLRFNARVDFENISRRFSAFIGREREDTAVRDRSERFTLRANFPHLEDHDETIAGLGYSLPESYRFKSEFRAGVRFAGIHVPRLFAHARFALNAYADDSNLIDLRLSPFVNTVDRFGLTGSVDFSHVFTPTRIIRWNNVATVTQRAPGMDWRSSVILYQALPEKRAIAFETFVRGYTVAPVPLVEYGVQSIFRQPLVSERLIGELVVGYSWPQEDPDLQREGSYGIAAILELPF